MARMIPGEVSPAATEGERRIWHFFKRLPDTYVLWQDVYIGSCECDFMLFTPKNGLIIFELKEWTIDQIESANFKETYLSTGLKTEKRQSPGGQAGRYLNQLKSVMKDMSTGLFPTSLQAGVIFPNITRAEFGARLGKSPSIHGVAPEEQTIFRDDIAELYSPAMAGLFGRFLDLHFPAQFLHSLPYDAQLGIVLRKFGAPLIELPSAKWEDREERILELDEDQRNAAAGLRGRRILVKGPAGSGKTLVLAARAALLHRANPGARILMLCFNLSLAGYLRRLLAAQGLPLGPKGVDVMPVYDLAALVQGARVSSGEDSDYYATVIGLALEELESPAENNARGKWQAVLVDEGQDFTPEMVSLVEKVADGAPILVAMDDMQTLYGPKMEKAWMAVEGMEAHTLSKRYRSTRQIMAFATDWLGISGPSAAELGIVDGGMPESETASSPAEAAELAAGRVAGLLRDGFCKRDIAVLYAKATHDEPGEILRCLDGLGIISAWPTEDDQAKRRFDITADAVTVSTMHSMKGMEFHHVVLLLPRKTAEGREHGLLKDMRSYGRNASGGVPSRRRRAVYVGMTRARRSLAVIWYDD